jgi:hypothetical protein
MPFTSEVMALRQREAQTVAMNKPALALMTAAFAILTGAAVWEHGVTGIFVAAVRDLASIQIFVDLVIALILILTWIWRDSKRTGRNPWPWLVATLLTGSFGPLAYLLTAKREPHRS